ncbi:MAG: hypothetical protein ACR2IP_09585 [Solirubrobacteraceae bacterium]
MTDADNALALAIQSSFGDTGPEHRQCEWHLGRKLRQHLPDELLADPKHPISRGLIDAFHTPEAWSRLDQAIRAEHATGEHRPLTLAVNWMDTYSRMAEVQIPTRNLYGINSTSPAEQILREIDRRIGDRVGSFTNRTRLSKLLKPDDARPARQSRHPRGPTACANASVSPADASEPTTP